MTPMFSDEQKIIQEFSRFALESVMPANFIPAAITCDGGRMTIKGTTYDLHKFSSVYVVSIGKAALSMAEALDAIIRPYVKQGIVLTKHLRDHHDLGNKYLVLRGGHPIPTEESIAGAEAILNLLDKTNEDDLVIFMISGGGSALMTKPLNNLELDTFQRFNNAVLGSGADIKEFNTLRKHLDGVKGGRLALHAAPSKQITLILSDVVGSPLDVIASGPTVPDPSTYQDAMKIFNFYAQFAEFPDDIFQTLRMGCEGKLPETLKENDASLQNSDWFLLADNRLAAFTAASQSMKLGLKAKVLNTALTGDAAAIGRMLPSFFSELEEHSLLILGGETTVQISGSGIGGRNQELALASVRQMADWPGCILFTLATDGEDGPTNAAGAFVTSDTLCKALAMGMDPDKFLKNHDSYNFFDKIGNLIRTGPSGTNVNDLTFLVRL